MAVKPIAKFTRNSRSGDVDPQRLFGNLAQTNHYQVDFSSLSTFRGGGLLEHIENKFGVNLDFISRDSGLLCSEASLPGTSLATAEVKDNFMGIPQEFAHTRLYTDFDFTFYVDNDYNNLRFFEGWIDFISSGSEILGPIGDGVFPSQSNYYRRMRYPDSYKCQTISITKFEKNFGPRMTYSFINTFPKLVNAIPVQYGGADILKVGVSFNYDRYIVNSYKKSNTNNNPLNNVDFNPNTPQIFSDEVIMDSERIIPSATSNIFDTPTSAPTRGPIPLQVIPFPENNQEERVFVR